MESAKNRWKTRHFWADFEILAERAVLETVNWKQSFQWSCSSGFLLVVLLPKFQKMLFFARENVFFADVSRNDKAREFFRLSFETVSLETDSLMELLVVFSDCDFPKFQKIQFFPVKTGFLSEASRNDKPREILRASLKRVNLATVFLKEFLVVFLWLHSSTISRNAVFAIGKCVFFCRRVAQREST